MGDRSVDLTPTARKMIVAMENGTNKAWVARMAANTDKFKRAGKFLGFVGWALVARDAMAGAVGQGHRQDLNGVRGAIDNAAYEAMMAEEIEKSFRYMADSAATAVGGLQGLGPIERKRIGMDLPTLGSERRPQRNK